MFETAPVFWLLAAVAVLLAAVIAWLWSQARNRDRWQARLAALQQQLAAAQADSVREQAQSQHWQHQWQQACAAQQALEADSRRLPALQQALQHWQEKDVEWQRLGADYQRLQQQYTELQLAHERLHTQWQQERVAQAEKLALLTEARHSLADQFKTLANDILEEKSRRFAEQNQAQLGQLLGPLHERMQGFGQLIQNTYEKESKERSTLEAELKRLQQLNSQLHGDARALTRALTGSQNKTQGQWGEMILEKVLENSGLTKGREYIVQASGTHTDADGVQRRVQPDVLVNLPENKHIIIDAKVSLTAYVRYTQAEEADAAARELAAHVQSLRQHIKGLAAKQYSDIKGLNSPDFVFLFVPVEPAYLLALQHDAELFDECFARRIMLVGPSTLLATLRTVANLWRTEQQNRHALLIAEEGGKLYDKFAGFLTTLEGLGRYLTQAQNQYQTAINQLQLGHGNLIGRVEKLRHLGVKAAKSLPKSFQAAVADAVADEDETDALPESSRPSDDGADHAPQPPA